MFFLSYLRIFTTVFTSNAIFLLKIAWICNTLIWTVKSNFIERAQYVKGMPHCRNTVIKRHPF